MNMKRIVTAFFIFSMLLSISCESQEKAYEYTGNDSVKIATIKKFEELGFTIVKNKKSKNPMEIPEDTLDLFVAFTKYHQNISKHKIDTTIVVEMITEEKVITE